MWLTSLFDPFMSINVAQLKVMGTYFARNTTHTGKANWTLLDKKYIKSLQISIAISHFCRAKSVGGLHHNLPQRQLKLIPNAETYNLCELHIWSLIWLYDSELSLVCIAKSISIGYIHFVVFVQTAHELLTVLKKE